MEYEIKGEPMPVVICHLDGGESVLCESGAMSWMTPNMEMQTSGGGAGKMFGRMFSGESAFVNRYTANGGPGMIAFCSEVFRRHQGCGNHPFQPDHLSEGRLPCIH